MCCWLEIVCHKHIIKSFSCLLSIWRPFNLVWLSFRKVLCVVCVMISNWYNSVYLATITNEWCFYFSFTFLISVIIHQDTFYLISWWVTLFPSLYNMDISNASFFFLFFLVSCVTVSCMYESSTRKKFKARMVWHPYQMLYQNCNKPSKGHLGGGLNSS